MNGEDQRRFDREQWRDLVRGLCLVQAGGYPGAVSISKRFPQSPLAEVEDMARIARHMVQEYGLLAHLRLNGDRLVLRIEKEDATAGETESPDRRPVKAEAVMPPVSWRTPFSRLLQVVLPTRAEA